MGYESCPISATCSVWNEQRGTCLFSFGNIQASTCYIVSASLAEDSLHDDCVISFHQILQCEQYQPGHRCELALDGTNFVIIELVLTAMVS